MLSRVCLRYGWLCFISFLTGCASSLSPINDADLSSKFESSLIEGVPYFPQVEDQCGPSSLAAMLGFRDVHVELESLRKELYIPEKAGAVTTEVLAQARRYALLAYPLDGELQSLLTELDAGNPVMILQNLGFGWMPMWHFSVVIGYDIKKGVMILRTGDDYYHEVDIALFLKTWERADRWAIVITSPEKLPPSARLNALLKSALELEQVGEVHTAFRLYRSILSKWPDQATALFGAGNSAYALGDLNESELMFRRYIEMNPNSADGWNNLAYVFSAQKCLDNALVAIRCGLVIAPENTTLKQSYEELQLRTSDPNINCPSFSCAQEYD